MTSNATLSSGPLTLWYDKPANEWLEAIPLGNGRLGGMVFGGVATETVQLNEDTLWAGGPHDYSRPKGKDCLDEAQRLVFAGEWKKAQDLLDDEFFGRPNCQAMYQPVGQLELKVPAPGDVTDYVRTLDLDTAIATTRYSAGGVTYSREVFASFPSQTIVMRLTADQKGKISFTAGIGTPQKASVSTDGNDLVMEGISGDAERMIVEQANPDKTLAWDALDGKELGWDPTGGIKGAVRFTALAHFETVGG
jgi:alpha-L-fucosidase 2